MIDKLEEGFLLDAYHIVGVREEAGSKGAIHIWVTPKDIQESAEQKKETNLLFCLASEGNKKVYVWRDVETDTDS